MKRLLGILAIVSVLLFSCVEKQPESVVVEPTPLPFTISDTLLQIDTLLQNRPDSALMLLIEPPSFRAQRGISYTFNESYRNLLLSEALYKTYNTQYYRDDLQAAMRFFDSLAARYPGNDDVAFYAARSHYMNGVSYYETDSVVAACREYLHALEIMEDHFDETHGRTSLQGYKVKFMGLTYGRLGELFSDQFMIDNALDCFGKALSYLKKDTLNQSYIANTEYHIGVQYDEKGMSDSAYYYYDEALKHLPDTNNVMYRDIVVHKTLLSYGLGADAESSLLNIKRIIQQADSYDEILTRYITLGYIYFAEKSYDSACVYWAHVFDNSQDVLVKLQSAHYLKQIYTDKNDEISIKKYNDFLASYTLREYDNKVRISQVGDLYKNYLISHDKSKFNTNKNYKKLASYVFLVFVIVAAVVCIIILIIKKNNDRKQQKLLIDLDNIRNENDNLRTEREKWLFAPIQIDSAQYRSFIEEPVCKEILKVAKTTHVTSRDKYFDHKGIVIEEEMYDKLEEAVMKHYGNFKRHLILKGIKKKNDHHLCYLYMLGLEDNQVAILKGRDYSTIKKQSARLQNKLETDKRLADYIISEI